MTIHPTIKKIQSDLKHRFVLVFKMYKTQRQLAEKKRRKEWGDELVKGVMRDWYWKSLEESTMRMVFS